LNPRDVSITHRCIIGLYEIDWSVNGSSRREEALIKFKEIGAS